MSTKSNQCPKIDNSYLYYLINLCRISLFKGDKFYENMTVDADIFGTMFGLPGEKWWEYYWKAEGVLLYGADKVDISSFSVDFYFIQYRPRNSKM